MMGFKTQLDQPEVEEIPPSWGGEGGRGQARDWVSHLLLAKLLIKLSLLFWAGNERLSCLLS